MWCPCRLNAPLHARGRPSIVGAAKLASPGHLRRVTLPAAARAACAHALRSIPRCCCRRTYSCKSFATALALCDKIAAVADGEGHHPDLHLTCEGAAPPGAAPGAARLPADVPQVADDCVEASGGLPGWARPALLHPPWRFTALLMALAAGLPPRAQGTTA